MIKDLNTLKEFFSRQVKNPIFGVGVYAFNRLGLEGVVPGYRLLALRHSLDTELIEKDIKTFSLEAGMGTKHIDQPRNSTTVICHERTREYLKNLDQKERQASPPLFVVYKSSRRMEQACRENNWIMAANPPYFGKELFEDKIKFRKILKKIGVLPTPGEIISFRDLSLERLVRKYSLPFVIQHPRRGGGKGTFFIKNKEDFDKAKEKLSKREGDEGEEEKTEEISSLEVIVAKFVKGPSPSIIGCVTRHGILSCDLPYQVLDMPQLYNPEKGSGLFCGHDWTSASFSDKIYKKAYDYVEKVGLYFSKQGYRGIFGLDFILDEEDDQLYVTECNPRLTASFPTLTMLELKNQTPPILAFHVLEFLNIDYEIDLDKINEQMRRKKEGSQMIMHNLEGVWTRNYGQLQAGVYKLKKGKLVFQRPGYAIGHLRDREEFIISEGVPFLRSHFSSNRRLCRILTLNKVLAGYKELSPWADSVARCVYQALDLRKISFLKIRRFFCPRSLAKG